jgi:OmpA-OmpF porin, OOP family
MLPALASAEDYVGSLRLPRASQQFGSGFKLASEPINTFSPWQSDSALHGDNGMKLRLGYQYSRFFSVQSEFIDYGRSAADVFASPGNLASAFRTSTGYGASAVATLPVWRSFSFYGRLGAYHGDVRNEFSSYSTSLYGSSVATRWRYGLGVRYDFTQRLGVHADVERYTPLGTPLGEPEGDQFSIGVNWRF